MCYTSIDYDGTVCAKNHTHYGMVWYKEKYKEASKSFKAEIVVIRKQLFTVECNQKKAAIFSIEFVWDKIRLVTY